MKTFPHLLEHHAQTNARGAALRHKRRGVWAAWTWQATAQRIRAAACGLAAIGAKRGDRIVVGGQNIPELYWTLTAIQCIGCVPVPLDVDVQRHDLISILNLYEVEIAVVRDQQYVDLLLDVKSESFTLRDVVFIEPRGLSDPEYGCLKNFAELQEVGRKFDSDNPEFYRESLATVTEDNLAIVVHTAGTTAPPKAVGLTHRNLVNTGCGIVEREKLTRKEELVAYLPLSWPSSIVFGYAVWLVTGCALNCPESEGTVFENMREIKPTFFYAPPKIYKYLLTTSHLRMSSSSRIARYAFLQANDIALQIGGKQIRGEPISPWDKVTLAFFRIIIFNGLKRAFGLSRLRLALTSMETISPDLLAFIRATGINLKQSYGLTETCACVAINVDGHVKWNVVGRALNGVDIALDTNGRILIRGAHLSAPREPIPPFLQPNYNEEWLSTDDLGRSDEEGDIHLIGRYYRTEVAGSPDLYDAPVIESILRSSPYIKDAVVFNNAPGALSGFLTLEEEMVSSWARRRAIRHSDYPDLISRDEVRDLISNEVLKINRNVGSLLGDERCLARFLILPRNFDRRAGELTRSWAICRRTVESHFASLIEALRSDRTEVEFVDRYGHYKIRVVDVKHRAASVTLDDALINANDIRLKNA